VTQTFADQQLRTEDAIRDGIGEIVDFVNTASFRVVLAELWAINPAGRPQFVLDVLLRAEELARRNVHVPDGLIIQRSTFRDNRPTLFCIVKHLRAGLLWEKVTITFDNPSGDPAIRYDDVVDYNRPPADML
jgi:hypothetical protein